MKIFLVLIVPFILVGCCSNDRLLTAKAIEPLTNVVLPDYEAYDAAAPKLNENEAGITEELKTQRKKTKTAKLSSADSLRKVVESLKQE